MIFKCLDAMEDNDDEIFREAANNDDQHTALSGWYLTLLLMVKEKLLEDDLK